MGSVQDSLEFMISQLKDEDRLSIVTYNDSVSVDMDLTKMDKLGKSKAQTAAKSLACKGQTNLSGGLLMAVKMLLDRDEPSDVSSVILFTDGKANRGITKVNSIINATKGCLTDDESKISIFTFGFGSSHDPICLQGISDAGNGVFYYINEDPESIPESFADCLGGLLSVTCQNCTLTCTPLSEGVKINSVETTYPVTQKEITDQKSGSKKIVHKVNLGDIYSEEHRDIIIDVFLPKIKCETDGYPVVMFTLEFFDIATSKFRKLTSIQSIDRVATIKTNQEDYALSKQYCRVHAANAIKTAADCGEKGDFDGAQTVLKEAISHIQNSISANDPFCKNLITQLQKNLGDVGDKTSFQSGGFQKCISSWQSNHRQRSNFVTKNYRNNMKINMVNAYYSSKNKAAPKYKYYK